MAGMVAGGCGSVNDASSSGGAGAGGDGGAPCVVVADCAGSDEPCRRT